MKAPQKILVIVGPTASGKSALAVELSRAFNGEVISADSRQVYRGLDIGTGKVTKREMRGVPHHLLDVADPRRPYSAARFVKDAQKAISDISNAGKVPIIAGGTGFYIDALLGRITLADVKPNTKLRRMLSTKTSAQLYALLQKKDTPRAQGMDTPSERNNKVRLIRALEIASAGGQASAKHTCKPSYEVLWIGTKLPFAALEKKIVARLKARMRTGMMAEAKRLHAQGLSYKRMGELGLEYRALARLLQGKISRAEFEEELARDIRKYAKRQITYWKRNSEIHWIPPHARVVSAQVRRFLRD